MGDRLIFKIIVEDSLDELLEEIEKFNSNFTTADCRGCALNLLNLFYSRYLPEEERVFPKDASQREIVYLGYWRLD